MPISNPCKWFVNGYDQKEFTYEGGDKLYHFSPNDNELSSVMDTNVVFFANNEQHALDVLSRMLKFRIDVSNEYVARQTGSKAAHAEAFLERAERQAEKAKFYLDAVKRGVVKLSEAPKNQFYKVGWADNDNILN